MATNENSGAGNVTVGSTICFIENVDPKTVKFDQWVKRLKSAFDKIP